MRPWNTSSKSNSPPKGRLLDQAVAQAQQSIAEGHTWVVDIDLEQLFDRVSQDKVMARLAARIADKRVFKLIRACFRAGVLANGVLRPTEQGTPQGGPLSPW